MRKVLVKKNCKICGEKIEKGFNASYCERCVEKKELDRKRKERGFYDRLPIRKSDILDEIDKKTAELLEKIDELYLERISLNKLIGLEEKNKGSFSLEVNKKKIRSEKELLKEKVLDIRRILEFDLFKL